jgi:hypothetical protein
MRVVVGLVVGAVFGVQLVQTGELLLDRCRGGQIEDERLDLGAQEVVGAARAERGELGRPLGCQEVEHHVGVGEVADHRLVGRCEPADRCERGARACRSASAAPRTGRTPPNGSAAPCSAM